MKPEPDLRLADPRDADSAEVADVRPPATCSDEELLEEVRECEAVVRRAMAKQYALMAEIERRGLFAKS